MAAINLAGGNTDLRGDGNGAAFMRLVDESGNPICKQQGDVITMGHDGVPTMVVNDGAARFARGDRMGNAGVALHTPLLDAVIDGATVNASLLVTTAVSQTVTQATGSGIALNSAGSIAPNGFSFMSSFRKFTFMARGPVMGRIRARLIKGGTNGVADWGFGDPTTNALLPNGAGFQYNSGGKIVPFFTFNGNMVTATQIDTLLIDSVKYYWWDIIVSDDSIFFSVQNPDTGLIIAERQLQIPADAGRMFAATALGLFARTFVGALAATAPATQLFVGQAYVGRYDATMPTGPDVVMAGMGLSLDKHPLTGAQTANAANSAVVANAAAMSNTLLGYATLGGRFAFAAVAGGVTDYALFGFQVPAGYQANVKSLTIETINTGAAVATTPTLLEWDIGVNSVGLSLASGGTIRAGGIGSGSLPIGAVPGMKAERISEVFSSPIVCESGRFMHLILRMPIATATASQVITGTARFNGFWSR